MSHDTDANVEALFDRLHTFQGVLERQTTHVDLDDEDRRVIQLMLDDFRAAVASVRQASDAIDAHVSEAIAAIDEVRRKVGERAEL